MNFFDKLGKSASKTYQATKEKATTISEELKLRGKISDYKEKIESNYNEIGKIVYSEVKDNKDVSKETVISLCEEISRHNDEISKLEAQILAVKNIKKCPNCGENLDLEALFCSKCGTKQPEIEKVEIKEETSDAKESEIVEVTNVENANEENIVGENITQENPNE